jgi:Mg2+-importing ATPase
MGPVSSLFDYLTFGMLIVVAGAGHDPARFQTAWFVESLLSQTLIVHVLRTGGLPFVHTRPSLPLAMTTLAICVLGLWLPTSPFAEALGFTPLPGGFWPALLVILAAYLGLTQLVKTWLIRRFGLD